jgi:hypothetical protein
MHFFLYLDVNQDVNLIGQNKKKCKAGMHHVIKYMIFSKAFSLIDNWLQIQSDEFIIQNKFVLMTK